MKCNYCNGEHFTAHQVCRMDIIIDGNGDYVDGVHKDASLDIYDSETAYGPFQCCGCGAEYDGNSLESAVEVSGPVQGWNKIGPEKELDLHLMTISQLVEFIAGHLDYSQVWKSKFPSCDFTVVDVQEMKQYSQEDLEEMHLNACHGWCGIKPVNFGFDSTTLYAVTDYYGGGCDQVCQLYDGIGVIEAEVILREAIRNTLSATEELVTDDSILLVEIRKEGE